MKTRRLAGMALALFLGGVSISPAVTRYVNVSNATPAAPFTNWSMAATAIQPAIDAAASGDEILVAPGTYYLSGSEVNIPIQKALTLRSALSRAAVIDAQSLSRGMLVLGTNSWVEGFTVRGGRYGIGYGGGISIGRFAVVRDCLVTANASGAGGGIMVSGEATNALVEDCTIEGNVATNGPGGGVVLYANSHARVDRCVVTGNVAATLGGGIWIQEGGSVSNSRIVGNRALGDDGGGIYMSNEGSTNPATLVNCVIAGNVAAQYGGGVRSSGPAGTLSSVVNCTIVSNSAGQIGGGAFAYTTRFVNDVIYFNSAPTNANLDAHMEVLSCIVSNCCTTSNYFWPNITNAPAFVDAGAGDFRLATASFCIDAGTTNGAPRTDIEGNPRPRQGKAGVLSTNCDMGACEYGFHFNEIRTTGTNEIQFKWDVEDRGIYRLQAATNAAGNPATPLWENVTAFTNGGMPAGQFLVHTQVVSHPVAMPDHALFRMLVSHTPF